MLSKKEKLFKITEENEIKLKIFEIIENCNRKLIEEKGIVNETNNNWTIVSNKHMLMVVHEQWFHKQPELNRRTKCAKFKHIFNFNLFSTNSVAFEEAKFIYTCNEYWMEVIFWSLEFLISFYWFCEMKKKTKLLRFVRLELEYKNKNVMFSVQTWDLRRTINYYYLFHIWAVAEKIQHQLANKRVSSSYSV